MFQINYIEGRCRPGRRALVDLAYDAHSDPRTQEAALRDFLQVLILWGMPLFPHMKPSNSSRPHDIKSTRALRPLTRSSTSPAPFEPRGSFAKPLIFASA